MLQRSWDEITYLSPYYLPVMSREMMELTIIIQIQSLQVMIN